MIKSRKTRQRITFSSQTRRPSSPLQFIGIAVTLAIVLGAGAALVIPRLLSHAATANPNMNCTLLVPANPLSARGLATPYQLSATNAADGACNEANTAQSAFVQGVIYNPATGAFSVYSPLIIDAGTQPAIAPTAPTLPQGAIVGLWFGFNATNLTLKGAARNTLAQAKCVNGQGGSVFGQFAYCNAVAFFQSANQGIQNGLVKIPALGTGSDGLPCPSTRDFSIVDQDQSDNVQTQYLANANGQIAQFSATNQAQIQNATAIANPSDNALITQFVDPTLGCTPWTAPDLANNNTAVSALPLDELMAAADQQAPSALIPITDPMTLNNNNASLRKTNLYRVGVDQTAANNAQAANGTTYCTNMIQAGVARLQKDQQLFTNTASPLPAVANSLFTFLANRLQQSFVNLNCQALTNQANPITVQMDGNGVAISATITTANGAGTGTGAGQQLATGGATFNLESNEKSVGVANNFTFTGHPNTNVDEQIRTDSCTGNIIFDQSEDTDANGANDADTVFNNVNILQIPGNWFFTLSNNNTTVACGSVVLTGTTGTAAQATFGTVLNAAQTDPTVTATGTATLTLNADTQTIELAPTFTYALRPDQAVNELLVAGSCTGTTIFSQRIDLGDTGNSSGDTTVNNVTALPNNWFYVVQDPNQNNAVVGCGLVKVNGVVGTATLGVIQ